MFQDPESLRVWYSIVYGGWALTLAGYAYYRIADMQNTPLRRQLSAALIVAVGAVFLAANVIAADGQPVMNPCSSCQGVAWNSWEYWLFMCWSC